MISVVFGSEDFIEVYPVGSLTALLGGIKGTYY